MQLGTVVLAAFGPTRETVAAIRRARQLVGPRGRVVVFPANREGVLQDTTVGVLRNPSVHLVDIPGRAGLEEALASIAAGAVLLTHDDVVVPRRAARRLTAALTASGPGTVAVPYLNEDGSPQALTGADPQLPGGRLAQVLATCLVASAEELRGYADKLIHGPHTVLRAPLGLGGDQPFALAAGAVVSHRRDCHRRLLPPVGPDGRPLLVASMIVRDEQEHLAACLTSLQGLVDRVEVCDTGSVDNTVEIARAAGAEVIQRPWRDDFAWARNEVLERCTDAWYVLWIDADERVTVPDVTGLRRRLATAVDDGTSFLVEVASDSDVAGDEVMTFLAPRIFSPARCHFAGALHETPVPRDLTARAEPWATLAGISIRHLGYTARALETGDKLARNVDVAKAAYARTPDATSALHYARALSASNSEPWLAAELYEQALASDRLLVPARAHALSALSALRLADGRMADALALAEEAVALVPADDDAAIALADAALAADRPQRVLELLAERDRLPSPAPLFTRSEAAGELASREVAAIAALGHFEQAYARALEVLELFPGAFDAWPQLVDCLTRVDVDSALELLLRAAVLDRGDGCARAVADVVDPRRAARFAAQVTASARPKADTVAVGLTAAMVAEDWAIFDELLSAAWTLPAPVVDQLVERLVLGGHDEPAQRLLAATGDAGVAGGGGPAPTPLPALPPLGGAMIAP